MEKLFVPVLTAFFPMNHDQTLDALPSHLVTPFNGPIPPSNLLDKIARGISSAKGPVEWPHSLRATRVKLIEICRQRAKEEAQSPVRLVTDENDDISCYNPDSDVSMGGPNRKNSSSRVRRPLYRQSSMDFLNTEDPKSNNDRITRFASFDSHPVFVLIPSFLRQSLHSSAAY